MKCSTNSPGARSFDPPPQANTQIQQKLCWLHHKNLSDFPPIKVTFALYCSCTRLRLIQPLGCFSCQFMSSSKVKNFNYPTSVISADGPSCWFYTIWNACTCRFKTFCTSVHVVRRWSWVLNHCADSVVQSGPKWYVSYTDNARAAAAGAKKTNKQKRQSQLVELVSSVKGGLLVLADGSWW